MAAGKTSGVVEVQANLARRGKSVTAAPRRHRLDDRMRAHSQAEIGNSAILDGGAATR